MNGNPYAMPRSGSTGLVEPVTRKRWVAVVLALVVPPVALLYVARPRRAIAYLATLMVNFPVVVFLGANGIGDPNMLSGLIRLLVSLVAAVDGYRLAQIWSGATLRWYSRAPALAAFTAVGFLIVLSLRAFVMEPFRIPSGSMLPTLQIGDHILVDKRSYAWEAPFSGQRIVRFGTPERGDVAVFRYPEDRQLHYVMRVVGLPGDTIGYANKRLSVNGKDLPLSESGVETIIDSQGARQTLARHQETLGRAPHHILLDPSAPVYFPSGVREFQGRGQCRYQEDRFECRLPAGRYFVMGDNRDNSSDSRYWGFVPEEDFVGRAFLIWYSAQDPQRAGAAVR